LLFNLLFTDFDVTGYSKLYVPLRCVNNYCVLYRIVL